MTRLIASTYFSPSEMTCHDGTPYPERYADRLKALFSTMDVIRMAWKGPLRVVSGYRTENYNVKVGGAKASQHVQGTAVDVSPICSADVMVEQAAELHGLILRLIERGKLPLLGGLGIYPRWVHVDVRPKPADGHVARWSGNGIGSEA